MTNSKKPCGESGPKNPLVNMKSKAEQAEAINLYGPIARRLAKQYATEGLPVEDLEQEGYLAILEFDEDKIGARGPQAAGNTSLKNRIAFAIRDRLKRYREKNVDPSMASLDEELYVDEDGNPVTRHDVIGTPATQEDAIEGSRTVRALMDLAVTSREILKLRAEGLRFSEIGQRLGKSETAVKEAWRRARKALEAAA